MNRTKNLKLLETVIGVITLNIGGQERVFTVFYGGAMYPWVDNKMLVMPEAKYNEMLKNFFKGDGQEFIVPSSTQIAQDRATVINNYRAGLYLNPDSASNFTNNETTRNDKNNKSENSFKDYTKTISEAYKEISNNYTENLVPEQEDKQESSIEEPVDVLIDDILKKAEDEKVKEEHPKEIVEDTTQEEQNHEGQNESQVQEDNEIINQTEERPDIKEKKIVSAENQNEAKIEPENVQGDKMNVENQEPDNSADTVFQQEEPQEENKEGTAKQTEEESNVHKEVAEDVSNSQGNDESLKEAELKINELNKENEILKEKIAEIKDFYREIKNDNSQILTQRIDALISETQKPNNELIDIKNQIAKLIATENKPDEKLSQLSNSLQDLIKRNENINLDQIKNLVDEQNSMMAKQNDTIQELTKTVESQKTIIDNFQTKIDETEKAEKSRVAKTWIIMIFGIIAVVGVMVCTQLFLPRAESAITLDPNTDAEIHIVIHNEDGTDSFERIGSLIIKDGKVQLSN